MAGRMEFRGKLREILELCVSKGNRIGAEEVETFFAGDDLSGEQMELVFDYLLSQGVVVKGYVKAGGTVSDGTREEGSLTPEEEEFLHTYEESLRSMGEEELAGHLWSVLELARELHHPEVFLGDLVQEGNMGLMTALSEGRKDGLLAAARECMQSLLEVQTETKRKDRRMAARVNELDQQIRRLTEEMGRKVSVEELAQFLEISVEEIEDILLLAGERVPEEPGGQEPVL